MKDHVKFLWDVASIKFNVNSALNSITIKILDHRITSIEISIFCSKCLKLTLKLIWFVRHLQDSHAFHSISQCVIDQISIFLIQMKALNRLYKFILSFCCDESCALKCWVMLFFAAIFEWTLICGEERMTFFFSSSLCIWITQCASSRF